MKDEQTAMVIRAVRRVTVAGMLVNILVDRRSAKGAA